MNQIRQTINILLFSNDQRDYELLRKNGFTNITYFNSILEANQYFKNHPEDFKQYDVVIEGDQRIEYTTWGEYGLEIGELIRDTISDSLHFRIHHHSSLTEDVSFIGKKVYQNPEEFLECLEKNVKKYRKEKELSPKKYFGLTAEEMKELPLPKKKEDIKILFLIPFLITQDEVDFLKSFGYDIDIKVDNKYSLLKEINPHLGDYDIIIGSELCSSKIIYPQYLLETAMQCEQTGRKLVSLFNYRNLESKKLEVYSKDESKKECLEDIVGHLKLKGQIVGNVDMKQLDYEVPYIASHPYANLEIILTRAVQYWLKAVHKLDSNALRGIEFAKGTEYQVAFDEKVKEIRTFFHQIDMIDKLSSLANDYFQYQQADQKSPKISVKDLDNAYLISIRNKQKQLVSSAIVMKEPMRDNIRAFSVWSASQGIDRKKIKKVGIYPSRFESIQSVLPQATMEELKIAEKMKNQLQNEIGLLKRATKEEKERKQMKKVL